MQDETPMLVEPPVGDFLTLDAQALEEARGLARLRVDIVRDDRFAHARRPGEADDKGQQNEH
jgi:hypothetical protein